jgi:glycosyltransferase involved in cell wall biosynthesis
MAKKDKRLKILWANRCCLLDTSSGASMSAREMLLQLASSGFDVKVIGATIFDSDRGKAHLLESFSSVKDDKIFDVIDDTLTHKLVNTGSHRDADMKLSELTSFFLLYQKMLTEWKPDLVWFYGGQPFDYLISGEAKRYGIPSVALLVNGNYKTTRWCEDVDLILTDSIATSKLYRERLNLDVTPIGKFVPREKYFAPNNTRKHITFINPTAYKGAFIVAQLALFLEEKRPDIIFEVVESRGRWSDILVAFDREDRALSNVLVTENTPDMRPIYARCRVLLAPGLWWESGGRVLVEAMINGIPTIVTNRGGAPEAIENGGIKISLPEVYYEAPYNKLLSNKDVSRICMTIEKLFDEEREYQKLAERAQAVGYSKYNIKQNTKNLGEIFTRLVEKN